MMVARKADPARAIMARITAALTPATVQLIDVKSSDWASVTFTGARHEFEIIVSGEQAQSASLLFVQSVGDIEFAIGGHIVADIAARCREIAAGNVSLSVEALSVESD